MWQLKHISAKNFMSFEELSYDFSSKCYVLKAENYDNQGQASNGSGKTSFIDVISIALLGYTISGRNTKNCVNWNGKENYFEVQASLLNEEHNLSLEIKRKYYSNTKSAELVILVNGEVPSTIPTKKGVANGVDIKEGNKYIIKELLDIAEEDILNYFLISEEHYQPFLQVNTDRKLEVIARFTNTEVVDKAIDKLDDELGEKQDSILEYESLINQAKGYIAALNDSLNEEAEVDFNFAKEARIVAIETLISQIDDQILAEENRIKAYQETSDSISLHIIDTQEKARLKELCSQMTTNEESNLLVEINAEISTIKNYLAGLITCPNCEHVFSIQSEKEYTEEDLNRLEADKIEVSALIEEKRIEINKIDTSLFVIESKERENKQKEREKASIQQTIKSIEAQKKRLESELEAKMLELDTESAKTFVDEKASILEQIESKEFEIRSLEKGLQEVKEEVDNLNKWIDNLNDFKFFLGNRPLHLITSLVNQYLELNGSDLNLQIEGFKKLKSGEIRKALNPVIYRNWMNPQDYNSFSAGEKCRLNICTDLAFQQLINASSKYGGLNLYISDELISSLDSLGVKGAAESFNSLGKTIVLVTHAGADLQYNNVISIEKRNNVSKIV